MRAFQDNLTSQSTSVSVPPPHKNSSPGTFLCPCRADISEMREVSLGVELASTFGGQMLTNSGNSTVSRLW